MEATRSALIIASDRYEDAQLAQLRAPGRDAEELAAVLRDPDIGSFDVQVSMNQRHYEVRIALENFFANRSPEDVLLLHFSCHGIKDEAGRLFFAAADTQKSLLNATAVAADYVNDLLNHARSRRIVLLLDCCFSGAFTRGMLARSGPSLDVMERLGGRGRAVLTASGALEYAWEGDALTRLNEPSIFTSAVVRALRSGEADRDGDRQISVDELYDYVYEAVRRETPNQTPGKWSNVEGTLVIARSPRPALGREVHHAPSPPTPATQPHAPSRPTVPEIGSWMPAVVITGGWIVAWLLGLALATSAWVNDMLAAVTLALVGWAITAPLTAAALRWAVPSVAKRRALLLGLGWPICIAVGLGAPVALRLSYEGAALLGIGVGVAGLLAATALTPASAPMPWDRVIVVVAGWCAGWLWSGVTAWPKAFWLLANEYANTISGLLDIVPFVQLAAGGVLSGIVGGALMGLLLRGTSVRRQ
jgi:Caspase domain